jgi:sterol desaturase/sphingolipid hydroxylase (fatty acid hydroxylase superfamily)
MELYGKILLYAMPCFLLLILLEKWIGHKKGLDVVPLIDGVSSLSSGITNVVKDVLGLSVSLLSYEFLLEHLAFFKLENSILVILIAFLTIDFAGYWIHRIAHQVNIFWNKHAIHHSSEEFNLPCALRQSISTFVNLFGFFLIPAAIVGVPRETIAIILPLHLFMQFWYHTKLIGKMGFLEYILVTPSHHRVHHAINPEYLDKNHSQIFIIWDKLFGTFQEELPDVQPVFGITRPAKTWNPIKINFQHLFLLIKDAWNAPSWKDKIRIWFMPTGWRPAGFEEQFPVDKIDDVYHFEKYNTQLSKELTAWSVAQLFVTLGFVSYLFASISAIGLPHVFYYGAFIFISVYSYSELMDKNKFAYVWEIVRFLYGMFLLLWMKSWFGLPLGISIFVAVYLLFSLLIHVYFSKTSAQTHALTSSL